MNADLTQYAIVFATTYLLIGLFLLMFKAALKDFNISSKRRIFLELRAVHPIALLAAFVSLAPMAVVRHDTDDSTLVFSMVGIAIGYFLLTLAYRYLHHIRLMDFSIDNGSNFNDEVSADPTMAQRIWLFWCSWAGALVLGTLSGFMVSYNSWKDGTEVLTARPGDDESRTYFLIFSGIVFLSIVMFMYLRNRKMRRLPTAGRLRRAINRAWFVPALFGFGFALIQDFTRNTTLANRYWTITMFVVIAVVSLWNFVFVLPNAKRHLAEDRQFFEERQKVIKKQKRKKKTKRK